MPPTSAARWKTSSGWASAKSRSALASRVRAYSRLRATKGSIPSASSRSTRCDPRKPPPPVTSTRMPASVDAEDGTVGRRGEAEGIHHRDHGPGRLLPRGDPAREGLRGLRDDPPLELVQHGPDRPHLR